MTNHTNCDHLATKAGRAACRKAAASGATAAQVARTALLEAFAAKSLFGDDTHFLFYAARHFANYTGPDALIAADAVNAYFLPSGDDARDANRRRNGYTITTNPWEMVSITLHAAS